MISDRPASHGMLLSDIRTLSMSRHYIQICSGAINAALHPMRLSLSSSILGETVVGEGRLKKPHVIPSSLMCRATERDHPSLPYDALSVYIDAPLCFTGLRLEILRTREAL